MIKKTLGIVFIFITVLISSCSAYTQESVTTKVELSSDKQHIILHCLQSSTGSCYFVFGETEKDKADALVLTPGGSVQINAVKNAVPYCVIGKKSSSTEDCKNQVLNPDGSITKIE